MLCKQLASLIALALPLSSSLCPTHAAAQADLTSAATPPNIEAELEAIEKATALPATDTALGQMWGLLASDYEKQMDLPRAEEAYGRSLELLRHSAEARRSYAAVLDGLGSLYLLKSQLAESENCRRKALAIFEAEGDRQNSFLLHGNLAATLLQENKFTDSEKEASMAIEELQGQGKLYAMDLVSALLVRSYARCLQHRCKEGMPDAKQAVDIVQSFLSPDSLAAATAWSALGYMEWKSGDFTGADENMRKTLQILSDKNPSVPHPVLVDTRIGALKGYQQFLNRTHRKAEARKAGNEMARLAKEQVLLCKNCTVNVEGLSNTAR